METHQESNATSAFLSLRAVIFEGRRVICQKGAEKLTKNALAGGVACAKMTFSKFFPPKK